LFYNPEYQSRNEGGEDNADEKHVIISPLLLFYLYIKTVITKFMITEAARLDIALA